MSDPGSAEGSTANISGLLSPQSVRSLRTAGKLELLLGPMFSGKTTELIQRLRRAETAGKKTLLLKWAGDRRYTDGRAAVATHDGFEMRARAVERLEEADNLVWSYDVVGIDEGQFFEDIAEFADKWATSGTTVIVAALDGDQGRQPFKNVLALVPQAEALTKLTAVCHLCKETAAFTRRRAHCPTDSPIHVGGKETYYPVCRSCHQEGEAVPMSPVRQMSQLKVSHGSASKSAKKSARTRPALDDISQSAAVPAMSLR